MKLKIWGNRVPERGVEELRVVWCRGSLDALDVERPHQHGEREHRDVLREVLPRADAMCSRRAVSGSA